MSYTSLYQNMLGELYPHFIGKFPWAIPHFTAVLNGNTLSQNVRLLHAVPHRSKTPQVQHKKFWKTLEPGSKVFCVAPVL